MKFEAQPRLSTEVSGRSYKSFMLPCSKLACFWFEKIVVLVLYLRSLHEQTYFTSLFNIRNLVKYLVCTYNVSLSDNCENCSTVPMTYPSLAHDINV